MITVKPSAVRKVARIARQVKQPSSHRPFGVPLNALTFEDRALQPDQRRANPARKLSFDLGPARLLALRVRIANGVHRPYPVFYIFGR